MSLPAKIWTQVRNITKSGSLQSGSFDFLFSVSFRVRTDHNEDNTSALLREWSRNVKPLYHRVLVNITENPKSYPDSDGPMHWTDERYGIIMELRQKALDAARKQWADYLFVSFFILLYCGERVSFQG